jgi:hypothetical protein
MGKRQRRRDRTAGDWKRPDESWHSYAKRQRKFADKAEAMREEIEEHNVSVTQQKLAEMRGAEPILVAIDEVASAVD